MVPLVIHLICHADAPCELNTKEERPWIEHARDRSQHASASVERLIIAACQGPGEAGTDWHPSLPSLRFRGRFLSLFLLAHADRLAPSSRQHESIKLHICRRVRKYARISNGVP